MQEIKFRAWDKENGMFNVTDLHWDGEGYLYKHGAILMQYTGLKDKNGKEIYEGDVVRYEQPYVTESTPDSPPEGDVFETNGQILFNEEDGSWLIRSNRVMYSSGLDIFGSDAKYGVNLYWWINEEISNSDDTSVEVIGNIYENPELLK